jgi:hypothetical protein
VKLCLKLSVRSIFFQVYCVYQGFDHLIFIVCVLNHHVFMCFELYMNMHISLLGNMIVDLYSAGVSHFPFLSTVVA